MTIDTLNPPPAADMPERQFVACKFNPWDRRTYTYHNDGPPLSVGDEVAVETARGISIVEVVAIVAVPPAFPTKPVILQRTDPNAATH